MAKDEKPAAADAVAVPAKKSKKLLVIIITVLVLVLGLVGAGAFFLLKTAPQYDESSDGTGESAKPVKKKAERDGPPIYVTLDAFTVNLIPENGDQFLQLILSAEVSDQATGEHIKAYMPKLRNDLTLLLSSKKASELINTEGKERLALEIKKQMNTVLEPASKEKTHGAPIREVLFTSFIIQ